VGSQVLVSMSDEEMYAKRQVFRDLLRKTKLKRMIQYGLSAIALATESDDGVRLTSDEASYLVETALIPLYYYFTMPCDNPTSGKQQQQQNRKKKDSTGKVGLSILSHLDLSSDDDDDDDDEEEEEEITMDGKSLENPRYFYSLSKFAAEKSFLVLWLEAIISGISKRDSKFAMDHIAPKLREHFHIDILSPNGDFRGRGSEEGSPIHFFMDHSEMSRSSGVVLVSFLDHLFQPQFDLSYG
jgi:hypothetical protein